jgi:hypothetical protein
MARMAGDHPLPHSNVHVLSIVAMPAHDVWPAPTPPLLHTRSYTLAHIHPARAAGGACGWRSDEALSWRLSLPPLSPHLCSSITPPIFLSLLSPPPAVGALYGWVLCMGGQRIGRAARSAALSVAAHRAALSPSSATETPTERHTARPLSCMLPYRASPQSHRARALYACMQHDTTRDGLSMRRGV